MLARYDGAALPPRGAAPVPRSWPSASSADWARARRGRTSTRSTPSTEFQYPRSPPARAATTWPGSRASARCIRTIHDATSAVRWRAPTCSPGSATGRLDVGVTRFLLSGESSVGGGPFEVAYHSVTAFRDGAHDQREVFDSDDVEGALKRFDELCAEHFGGVTLSPLAREPIEPPALELRGPVGARATTRRVGRDRGRRGRTTSRSPTTASSGGRSCADATRWRR